MFERHLERAKAGEIDAAAIAVSRPDGRRALEHVFTGTSVGNLCVAVVALFFAFGAGLTAAHNFQDGPR
jgi:hypothetical protein